MDAVQHLHQGQAHQARELGIHHSQLFLLISPLIHHRTLEQHCLIGLSLQAGRVPVVPLWRQMVLKLKPHQFLIQGDIHLLLLAGGEWQNLWQKAVAMSMAIMLMLLSLGKSHIVLSLLQGNLLRPQLLPLKIMDLGGLSQRNPWTWLLSTWFVNFTLSLLQD